MSKDKKAGNQAGPKKWPVPKSITFSTGPDGSKVISFEGTGAKAKLHGSKLELQGPGKNAFEAATPDSKESFKIALGDYIAKHGNPTLSMLKESGVNVVRGTAFAQQNEVGDLATVFARQQREAQAKAAPPKPPVPLGEAPREISRPNIVAQWQEESDRWDAQIAEFQRL